MQPRRPMLAVSEPIDPLALDLSRGPVWVSPKIDGFRCLQHDRVSLSRTLNRLPNLYLQSVLARPEADGLDGEITVGSPTAPNCFDTTSSAVRRAWGEPDFTYHVFDRWDLPGAGFRHRKRLVATRVDRLAALGLPVVLVPQRLCRTNDELFAATEEFFALDYEGAIVRSYDDPYKYNRSTLAEGYMLKVKKSLDSEFIVDGFEEMCHNDNEAVIDARGLTKRSTHKANKRPAGTLGKLLGTDVHTGQRVTVGPGFMTAPQKLEVWHNRPRYLGRIGKYRFAGHGAKNLPRFPRWIGWRDEIDM